MIIDAPRKNIPERFFENVGELELFNCNYDGKRLKLDKNLPSFYNQIILYWQDISSKAPLNKQDILSQKHLQQ